jgi:non-heme chloroperoxidase
MPHFVTASGTGIYYRDWGPGRPVILVEGWPANGEVWQPHALFLADHGYRVLHGLRRTCPDDLGGLIEGLNLDQITLVGYTTGSQDVAAYLGKYGTRRIAQIVLISPATPLDGALVLRGDLDGHRDRLNAALLDLLDGYSSDEPMAYSPA